MDIGVERKKVITATVNLTFKPKAMKFGILLNPSNNEPISVQKHVCKATKGPNDYKDV